MRTGSDTHCFSLQFSRSGRCLSPFFNTPLWMAERLKSHWLTRSTNVACRNSVILRASVSAVAAFFSDSVFA